MKKIIPMVLLIFAVSSGKTDIFSSNDKDSPVTRMKYFEQNGFKTGDLYYKKADVMLDRGLFNLTLKTELDTQIWVEILIAGSDDKKSILKGFVLGREKIIVDSSCIQEVSGKVFNISFCLPEKIKYEMKILSKYDEKSFTDILKYNIETKNLYNRNVFIQDAFYNAVTENKKDLITEIIQCGDNLSIIKSRNKNGDTLLLRACREGSFESVKLLTSEIITNNKVKSSYNGGEEKHPSSILFDMDDSDNEGRTGLMLAAINKDDKIIEYLLSRNANCYMRSDEGMTALDYAKKNNGKKAIALLEKYPVIPGKIPEDQLIGKWEGLINNYYSPFFGSDCKILNIEITKKNGRLKGKALYILGLDVPDIINAVNGKMPKDKELSYLSKFVCEQELNIFINGNEILFIGIDNKLLYNGQKFPDAIPFLKLKTGFIKNGIIYGNNSDDCLFYLENNEMVKKGRTFNPERSKITDVTSDIFHEFKYKYYVPESYDPANPSSVIFFYLPGTDAKPLSVQTAEENGWISVGLYKNGQDIFKAVIEIKNRFNTAGEKIYLAGFSMTGGNAHSAAYVLGYHCGGIICMGNWGSSAPHFGIPCFYIFGDKDLLPDQFAFHENDKIYKDFKLYFNEVLKPAYGNLVELQTFKGGHAYGVPELHAAAMKWLKSR